MADDEFFASKESKPPKIQLKVKEEPNKKYGLILKQKKAAPAFNAFSNIFRPGGSARGGLEVKPEPDGRVKRESGLGVAAAAFQENESEESDHVSSDGIHMVMKREAYNNVQYCVRIR